MWLCSIVAWHSSEIGAVIFRHFFKIPMEAQHNFKIKLDSLQFIQENCISAKICRGSSGNPLAKSKSQFFSVKSWTSVSYYMQF